MRRWLNHFERRPLNPYPLVSLPPVWRGPMWWLASRLPARRRPVIDAATRARLAARYTEPNERLAARHGIRFS
jgi:hypothetical protein